MFEQKLYGIMMFIISALSMKLGEGAIAMILIPCGLFLLFTRRNWINR